MNSQNKYHVSQAQVDACELKKSAPLANVVCWLAVAPVLVFLVPLNLFNFNVLLGVSIGASVILLLIYAQLVCYGKILYINSNTKRSLAKVKKVQTFPFWLVSISITVMFAVAGICWH